MGMLVGVLGEGAWGRGHREGVGHSRKQGCNSFWPRLCALI